eukprot:scaffold4837_cov121-Isochrysis_galbana.AAC.4
MREAGPGRRVVQRVCGTGGRRWRGRLDAGGLDVQRRGGDESVRVWERQVDRGASGREGSEDQACC